MSSSELALEAVEPLETLELGAPDSPSSSQALALTANSSRCTSPLSSPSPIINDGAEEFEDEEMAEREVEEEGEEVDGDDQNEAVPSCIFEDENETTLNLSLPSKGQLSSANDSIQQDEQLESIINSGNCSSRSSSCDSRSSTGSVKQHQQSSELPPSPLPQPPPPPLPSSVTVVNNSNINNIPLNLAEHDDLPSNNFISGLSASALAAAAAAASRAAGHKFNPRTSGEGSRGNKSKQPQHMSKQLSYAADISSVPNPQSPDFVQLLLEYRQVLLDMLAKSITLNETNTDYNSTAVDPKSVTLPLKCHCGFNSKLSNQITRSSTYVHQLELRFRSLMEASRATEAKYTPKRPHFINSASQAFGGAKVGSLLDKKAHLSAGLNLQQSSRQSPSAGQKPVSLPFTGRSGASSINSSLNGGDDEEDADSEGDDANEDDHNVPSNGLNIANFNSAAVGSSLVEEMNGSGAGGKTILEGYLESMKSHMPSVNADGSEDEDGRKMMMDQMGGGPNDDDLDGPEKRIDLNTKRLVVQMINSGISVSNISRHIGVSRKSVKQIAANYRAYGMLEKKRESRIHKGMQSMVAKLYAQGRSLSDISRAMAVSKPTVAKIIKQLADSNAALTAQGQQNGFMGQHNGVASISNMKQQLEMQQQQLYDDMDDEEKQMVVDEDARDDDDQDLDFGFEEDDDMLIKQSAHLMDGPSILSSGGSAFPLALTKHHQQQQPHNKKQRQTMSLIQNSLNNGSNGTYNLHAQQSPQQAHMNSNGNSSHQHLLQSQLSLIQQQSERYNNHHSSKPYDMKMRQSGGNLSMDLLNQSQHNSHRMSKSSHIVPQSANPAKLYAMQQRQQQQQLHQQQQLQQQQQQNMRMNSSSPRNENHNRMKSLKAINRLNNEMSIKESIMSMPEADKNNNTTLTNCNVTISSSGMPGALNLNSSLGGMGGGHMSNSSSGQHSPSESNSLMPPIPASMGDSNSDSEGNMLARPFVDGFPAGIMNSLNPNRATKLTLEDFNVVWQLRSQHWTHNQIRKYFEQRGKSISKSSISRIMNGKQRNFQQFFNVIPSTL